MAAISASMVGELRAKTDAPMMECKKALTEAEGDMERAEELLRVKLGSKAGKAASRIRAEGVIVAASAVLAAGAQIGAQAGAVVEVNCETDFTSKNDMFLAMIAAILNLRVTGAGRAPPQSDFRLKKRGFAAPFFSPAAGRSAPRAQGIKRLR